MNNKCKYNPTDSPKSLAFTFGLIFLGVTVLSLIIYAIVSIDIFTTIAVIFCVFSSICCMMAYSIKNSDFKSKKKSAKIKPAVQTV